MRKTALVVRAFVVVSLVAGTAFSQTAQLTGTVTDQSAAIVVGAKVTASNVDTGVARSSVANQSGNYLITALLRGAIGLPPNLRGSSRSLAS